VTNFKVKIRILEDSYKDLLKGKPDNYSPFRPGMTATVDIITDTRSKAVAVPISAIVVKTDTSSAKKAYGKAQSEAPVLRDEKFECVFINDNGKAKLRVVETGIQDDTNIEVTSGINEGEAIIIGPYNLVSKSLKPGDLIEEKKSNTTEE
jgi:HlyD family secretion protein